MVNVRLASDVRDLFEASDLARLRGRLRESLAVRGFPSLSEYKSTIRQGEIRYGRIWSAMEESLSGCRDELRTGIHEKREAQEPRAHRALERWRAAQTRPYLTTAGAARQFPVFREYMGLYRDFGLRVAAVLVVPLPPESASTHSFGIGAEAKLDLRNIPEAVTLISTYYHMSQVAFADNGTPMGLGPSVPGPGATGADPAVDLTEREQQVLRWAVAGKTYQDIAEILGMSVRTVRYHIDRARERYGYATNQQAIVRAALDYGFDPLGVA